MTDPYQLLQIPASRLEAINNFLGEMDSEVMKNFLSVVNSTEIPEHLPIYMKK
jgi:hypothetical protein